ncbi:MAG TPA: hypothetical protein VJ483_01325 [Holophagaceae bacterium]|nr:hypothetical protein [Holophagaceae bacterium]
MLVCQWHLDVPYGKQKDAVNAMLAWKKDAMASSGFKKAGSMRLMVGHIGPSPAHLVSEYTFESLADWEQALASMAGPVFQKHSEALAPLVVAGSQRWEIYRIAE